MTNEKCNMFSFSRPLLFNFYLRSYAFLSVIQLWSRREEHEDRPEDVTARGFYCSDSSVAGQAHKVLLDEY